MASAHSAQANTPDHRRGRAWRARGITAMVLGACAAPPPPPSVADHAPVWPACVSGTLRTTNPPKHHAFVQQSFMALSGHPEGMKIGARPATSVSLGAGEPVQQSDAGASGTPKCCYEHATQTPCKEAPPGVDPCRQGGRSPMDQLIERCAGLDVHKKTVAACLRVPGPQGERRQETRTFSTMTDGLLALRDWLCAQQVRVVGMESTGSYWKPVYYLLEDDLECWLLNA